MAGRRSFLFRLLLPLGLSVFGAEGASARAGKPLSPDLLSPRRLEALSGAYLGVPYLLDCLGEGSGPDPDPLFTRKYADCQTLVEQVLAEALAPAYGDLTEADRQVRYRGGEARIEDRYHYCVPDWLENPWPARDITAAVAGGRLATVRRTIDLPALLAARGVPAARSPLPARTVTAAYIPRAGISRVLDRIPDGSIALWVSSQPQVVIGHMGFVFRPHGVPILRHASQLRKRVIDQPVTDWLAHASRRFIGLMVLQPDVTGLRRRSGVQAFGRSDSAPG